MTETNPTYHPMVLALLTNLSDFIVNRANVSTQRLTRWAEQKTTRRAKHFLLVDYWLIFPSWYHKDKPQLHHHLPYSWICDNASFLPLLHFFCHLMRLFKAFKEQMGRMCTLEVNPTFKLCILALVRLKRHTFVRVDTPMWCNVLKTSFNLSGEVILSGVRS